MSLPTLAKGALGLGAASATATGAAYAGGLFNKNSKEELVSTLLKIFHPQKRLITASERSDSKWKEAWKKYKKDNEAKKSGEDSWSLKGWTKPDASKVNSDEAAPDYFVRECKSRSSQKTSGTSSDLYQNVLKYCTRDTLVSDLISEYGKGKKLLTTSSSEGDWKEVWKLYRDQNKANNKSVDDWKFSDWGAKKEGDTLPTDYQKKCSEKSLEPAFEIGDVKYLNVLTWCSK
ncbi:hypothetical protein HF1_03050 [Mycoplasma haemofelis str. Langford 1]|uniref:Lipoprotein n=1 Tax=Mycoplasma haemofelis (strain Langford 1) TaxID=941640 RepID=E8ZGP2_MYCHL|nr:hypothetical protein [Mycoplasma haemofelis]CBY92313.1 hypothetical protein HF1_03050 [Mycoplasma haemofelis str. Langford 1]